MKPTRPASPAASALGRGSDDFADLQLRVARANQSMVARGLAVGTFGNVSEVDRDRGVIAIKPSGVDYESLTPADIPVLDLTDGSLVAGTRRASADAPIHLELYRGLRSPGGICHTHSTYATAWAQAARPIPLLGTTHADHLTGPVPCCDPLTEEDVAGDYEAATGRAIVAAVEKQPQAAMALVPHHGAFAWGADALEAVAAASILEHIATLAHLTLSLDVGARGPTQAVVDRHYFRKHGPGAYYGQPS